MNERGGPSIETDTDGLAHALVRGAGWVTETGTWWIMGVALAVGMACLLTHAIRRLADDRPRSRAAIVIPLTLFGGALLVRLFLAHWTHYVFNDEYLYLRHAAELHSSKIFSFASQPPLLIYLYSLAFEFLPLSASTTFLVTTLVGSLTAPALWGCLRSLRVEQTVAILAGALLALHPLHVKHSGASSLEVVSLLIIVATVGTFARWVRTAGTLELSSFAVCLFGALTVRVENFVLVPALVGIALLLPDRRRPRPVEFCVLGGVIALASLYLPGVLLFHGEQQGWWKSELGPLALLANNLAFWVGGDLRIGKISFLLLLGGVIGSWRSARPACLTWIALLSVYSVVYVVHGVNLGYTVESQHSAYFASRSGGHDMFRFNVPLLPAIVFFLASGVVAWIRFVDNALQRLSGRSSAVACTLVLVTLGALLLSLGGEYRAYDPLGFLASRYNRPVENAEYHFLEDGFADVTPPAICYTIAAPIEPFLGRGIDIRQIKDISEVHPQGEENFFYVNSLQLGAPRVQRLFERLRNRFRLEPIAQRRVDSIDFALFRLRPPASREPSG